MIILSDDVDGGYRPGPRHNFPDDGGCPERDHRHKQYELADTQSGPYQYIPHRLYDLQI